MGLDMYLKKHTYIGAQYEHRNVNGKIEITEGSENKPVKIDFKRVIGEKRTTYMTGLSGKSKTERMIARSTAFPEIRFRN